jgi:TolB protein
MNMVVGTIVGAMLFTVVAPAKDVYAAHPGANGKILFEGWGNVDGSTEPDASQYDIWIAEPDGSGVTNLTDSPGVDMDAKWSPDGTKIAFSSNRAGTNSGDYDIYVMAADGSNLERLTSSPGSQSYASWSPTGERIAFRDPRGLWIMAADGSHKTLVYKSVTSAGPLGGEINHVDWSPDGGLIAFSMDAGEGTGEDIWAIKPDGSRMRQLYASDGHDLEPDFSPDGRRVAFSSFTSCIRQAVQWCFTDIVVIRRDGTHERNLTSTPSVIESDPAWSPDGKQIVYSGDNANAGMEMDIWIMGADGQNRRPLVLQPQTYDYQPNWQPLV